MLEALMTSQIMDKCVFYFSTSNFSTNNCFSACDWTSPWPRCKQWRN